MKGLQDLNYETKLLRHIVYIIIIIIIPELLVYVCNFMCKDVFRRLP